MGNYEQLKSAVAAVIKANGRQEITGQIMQSTLLAIINAIAKNSLFAGVATPATTPGTPDENVFYLAGPGIYPNFNSAKVTGISVFRNVGNVWQIKELLKVAGTTGQGENVVMSQKAITELLNAIDSDIDNKEDKDKTFNFLPLPLDRIEAVNQPIEPQSMEGEPDAIVFDTKTKRFVYDYGGEYVNNYEGGNYYNETVNGPARKDKIYLYNNRLYTFVPGRGLVNTTIMYDTTGNNKDGTMTQDAITQALNGKTSYPYVDGKLWNKEEKEITNEYMTMPIDGIENVVEDIVQAGTEDPNAKVIFDTRTKRFVFRSGIRYYSAWIKGDYYNIPGSMNKIQEKKLYRLGQAVYTYSPATGTLVEIKPKGGYMRKELESVGMAYNENTKFYEYQGVTDLTEEDAINILMNGKLDVQSSDNSYQLFDRENIRLMIPTSSTGYDGVHTTFSMFADCFSIEKIDILRLVFGRREKFRLGYKCYNMFSRCYSLREILTPLVLGKNTVSDGLFDQCSRLEKVYVEQLQKDLSFKHSPNLTVGDTDSSLQHVVDNAANDKPITITLHPTAFARVSSAMKEKARAKQITIASA